MPTALVDAAADPALAADPLGWFDDNRPGLLAAIGQGLASRARTFTFTVKVIDANGITATRTVSITTSRHQP
ncbi:hypothetical protein [Solwaraspora sp. WMMA2101]